MGGRIIILLLMAAMNIAAAYIVYNTHVAHNKDPDQDGCEIRIKDPEVLSGMMIKSFDPKLVEIAEYISTKYGMFVTESYRDALSAGDLHSTDPVRAIDLRSRCYTKSTLKSLILDVNRKWVYDSTRPGKKCLILHNVGRGMHLHLQVHPNTFKMKEKVN